MSTDKKESPFPGVAKKAVYSFNPFDLAIMGGKDSLPENERGPLDTVTDKDSPLFDPRLKSVKLPKEWVANIGQVGVLEAAKIVKIGDTPFVMNGRQRVRGARAAMNAIGKDAAPILVPCIFVTLSDTDIVKEMVSLNLHFAESPTDKISKLQRLIAMGVSTADAATVFGTREATVKTWIQYDNTAIAEVKKAVASNKIPHTTGMDIARLGDEEKQKKALDKVLATAVASNGSRSERKGQAGKAKRAIAAADGKSAGISEKKTLKKLLAMIGGKTDKTTKPETKAWWHGVACGLALVIGGEECDERLTKLVEEFDSAPEPEVVRLAAKKDADKPPSKQKKAGKGLKPATEADGPPVTDDEE